MNGLIQLSPVWQALLATLLTWTATIIGSTIVFFLKTIQKHILQTMIGFAAGVMIAASFWSLLIPSIQMAETAAMSWFPPAFGFFLGGAFLYVVDKIIGTFGEKRMGHRLNKKKSLLFFLAVTLHNAPEGLAIGIAFGALASGMPYASLAAAISLTLGVAIQNLPEGAAVTIPFRKEGYSRWKAFIYGQSSALVEPFAGVIGALLILKIQAILPYALAFAAGAMMYVVIEELIPDAKIERHTHYGTIGAMVGFLLMMVLDGLLG